MKEKIRELLNSADELLSEIEDNDEMSDDDREILVRLMDQVYDLLQEADQFAYGLRMN